MLRENPKPKHILEIINFLNKINNVYILNKCFYKYKNGEINYKIKISDINYFPEFLFEIIDYHFKHNTDFDYVMNDNSLFLKDHVKSLLELLYPTPMLTLNKYHILNISKLIHIIFNEITIFYKDLYNIINNRMYLNKQNDTIPVFIYNGYNVYLSKNLTYIAFMLFNNTSLINSDILINKIISSLKINYLEYNYITSKSKNIIKKSNKLNKYIVYDIIQTQTNKTYLLENSLPILVQFINKLKKKTINYDNVNLNFNNNEKIQSLFLDKLFNHIN